MQCLIFVFLIVLISCDWSDKSYGVISVLGLEECTNSHVSSNFGNNYSGSFKAKMYGSNPYFFGKWIQKEKKWGWKESKPWANSKIKLFATLACRAIHMNVLLFLVEHVLGTQLIILFCKSISKRSFVFALLYIVSWFDGLFLIFVLMVINLYHVLRPKILQQHSGHFSLKC